MFPILLKVGPITLHTYGLMVALGFIAALKVARTQFLLKSLPLALLDKLVFYLMIFGLLGARILYFGLEDFAGLRSDPLSFFRVWEGGLVFYGGVLAGLIGLAVFSRKLNVPFFSLTDVFVAPLLIGHAIGRLGCFAAGCCYGQPCNLPWGVLYKNPESLAPLYTVLHPTQIYEAIGDFVLFVVAVAISKTKPRASLLTSFYCVSYGLLRFLIEFLRGDDRGVFHFGLSPSQWIAVFLIAVGLLLFLYEKKQKDS